MTFNFNGFSILPKKGPCLSQPQAEGGEQKAPVGQSFVFWGGLCGMIFVPVFSGVTQCPAWSLGRDALDATPWPWDDTKAKACQGLSACQPVSLSACQPCDSEFSINGTADILLLRRNYRMRLFLTHGGSFKLSAWMRSLSDSVTQCPASPEEWNDVEPGSLGCRLMH